MLRHQVQGAQRNGLWTRASAAEPGGLPSVDSAAQVPSTSSLCACAPLQKIPTWFVDVCFRKIARTFARVPCARLHCP